MNEPNCPKCKREYPIGWTENLEARRRQNIRATLAEKKLRGEKVGRPRSVDPEVARKRRAEGVTIKAIAESFGVSAGAVQYALRVKQ